MNESECIPFHYCPPLVCWLQLFLVAIKASFPDVSSLKSLIQATQVSQNKATGDLKLMSQPALSFRDRGLSLGQEKWNTLVPVLNSSSGLSLCKGEAAQHCEKTLMNN